MSIAKKCGLFFLITFGFLRFASCSEELSLDLEHLIITKTRIHLLNSYSVTADSLKNFHFDSPIEALGLLPLDLQSRSLNSGIQTDFSLRGSNFQGVLILLNGQRINDPQTGHHNSDIPITKEDVEKMEFIPGASSSLFGPDAIGGAINIILKKPNQKYRVLEFEIGQYKSKSGLFSIGEKKDNLGVRFSLERRESAGFYYDTDFKKLNTTFSSSLEIPDGELDLNLGYQEKEFGAYDFYTPFLGYPSKEWTKTYLLSTSLSLEKEGLLIRPNFLWRRHYDKFMLDKTQVRSSYLNHHRTDVLTPNIYLQKETNILGRIGLGLEYGQEEISSTNLGKHNRDRQSMFLDDALDLNDKLSSGFSLRWDKFTSFDHVYTGLVNFRYKFSKGKSIYYGVSRSIRIPSFTELYYNDPTTAGNSDLSKERSLSYNLGYDYKKAKLTWGISFFFRKEDGFIDWIKSTPSQTKWLAQNITEADVFGIEERVSIELSPKLSLDANYFYNNKHINDQGYLYKYGQNYTRHLSNITLLLRLPFGAQSLGLTFKKKPHRDGWLLFNTHFSYNLHKNSQIFLKIANLFNVEYQEIEGIPQPGRWIQTGLRFEW